MISVRALAIAVFFISVFSAMGSASAGAVDGKWLFRKDKADNLDRALNISGSSFTSLISTAEGVAYETGWWTESPGTGGRTNVITRYSGDNDSDTIEYKMESPDKGILWLAGEATPWGIMSRMNCDLSMQYRNKSDNAPEGCAYLHVRGWGYSGLEGECTYNEDWVNTADDENGPMACLIEAPAKMAG